MDLDELAETLHSLARILPWLVLGFTSVIALHVLYFMALPGRLMKRAGSAAQDRRRKYLEWIAATPSLLGRSWRVPARLYVLQCHVQQGRHEEVVRTCRLLLAGGLAPASVESTTRRHLADSLEALGDPEAADERLRARDCLKGVEPDALSYVSRGQALERENRHAEAYAVFAQGLELGAPKDVRIQLLMKMSLSAYHAGRVEDSARHAEEAIAEGAEGTLLRLAHRHAGMTLGNLGRLDEAEAHSRKGLEIARRLGDAKDVGAALADLAEFLRKSGRLAEALRACDEAIAVCPEGARHGLTVRLEVLKSLGEFRAARAALDQARRATPLVIPHYERRMQALFDIASAWIALDQRIASEARAFRLEAEPVLAGDPKLRAFLIGADARIAALEGDHALYTHSAEQLEALLPGLSADRSALRGALTSLGKAAVAIGDFDYALACWERYLGLAPDPVDLPMGLYHLGLAREGLGQVAEARAAFKRAQEAVSEAHYARLASGRLRALGLG